MEDDLFGDLLGTSKPSATAAAGSQGLGPAGSSGKLKPHPTPAPAKPLPDMFGASNGSSTATEPAAEPAAAAPAAAVQGVSKEELHAVVSGAVQAALDATFGKFVKSLRTVLEDIGKRVDVNGQAVADLSARLEEVFEVLDSSSANTHARFTSVDVALKEIDRGVQALRDKQELNEAQAMLAKFATNPPPGPGAPDHSPAPAPTPGNSSTTVATVAQQASATQQAPAPAAPPVPAVPPAPAAPAAPPAPVAPPAPAPPTPPQAQQQQAMQAPAYGQPPQQPAPVMQPPSMPAAATPDTHAFAPAPQPQYSYQQASAPTQSLPPSSGPSAPGPAADPYHIGQQPSTHGYGTAPPAPHYHGPGGPGPQPQLQPQSSLGQPVPHMMPSHMGPPPGLGLPPGPMPLPMSLPAAPPQPSGPSYPTPSGPSYPSPGLSYPAPPQSGSYGGGYRQPNLPGPPPGLQTMSSMGSGPQRGPPPESRTSTRSVRLDDIIADITAMGFERHQVMAVINSMQKAGQAVDLNVVIDRLTNGRY